MWLKIHPDEKHSLSEVDQYFILKFLMMICLQFIISEGTRCSNRACTRASNAVADCNPYLSSNSDLSPPTQRSLPTIAIAYSEQLDCHQVTAAWQLVIDHAVNMAIVSTRCFCTREGWPG